MGGNVVNAASNCDEALEESTACQDRAMAAHDADYVEPSVELGKDWLELEARRNCRFITCIDELVAFCPDMLKPVTKSYLGVVDKFEELAVGYEEDGDWDTEKCPGAVALKAKKDLELTVTDCLAEVDKFTACSDQGKQRRDKWLDTVATGDGRDHFAERKLCNWITEDYEQCYKPFVQASCGFEQKTADDLIAKAVDIIHSHFPDWDSQKCPTASHVLSQRQKNEEGNVDTEAEHKIKGKYGDQEEVEDESEKSEGGSEEADQRGELGTGNESSNPQKIFLLGFALIALIPLSL